MSQRLYVDYCGEEHACTPDRSMSFGREADLVIDTNPYLHRVLGVFAFRDGHWFLSNVGRSIVINVADRTGPTSVVLAPGRSLGLAMAEFAVSFVAGRTRYEFDAALEGVRSPVETRFEQATGQRTLEWGMVELNPEQHLLLVELASDRLANPHADPSPSASKATSARRLGWSLSKYNRKLDHLCQKLDRVGVPGLHGAEGIQASDRRRVLVDHALAVGLVTADDLALLNTDAEQAVDADRAVPLDQR
ncbi:MAG: hypothetical protein M5U19_21540 [Microthrixaceae bacterium]|nr:hypothetical protein [Microthrixaceae bacterium]